MIKILEFLCKNRRWRHIGEHLLHVDAARNQMLVHVAQIVVGVFGKELDMLAVVVHDRLDGLCGIETSPGLVEAQHFLDRYELVGPSEQRQRGHETLVVADRAKRATVVMVAQVHHVIERGDDGEHAGDQIAQRCDHAHVHMYQVGDGLDEKERTV